MPIQTTDIDATGGADGYDIGANYTAYIIDSGVSVLTTTGIAVEANFDDDVIDNFGQLAAGYGTGVALYGSSANSSLINEASGSIVGKDAVIVNGANDYIANYGTMTASQIGIEEFAGSGTHVDNYGRITGNSIGVEDEAANDVFFNHGSISSIGTGFSFAGSSGTTSLNNTGTISGMTAAIASSGSGALTITNKGAVDGDVTLTNSGGTTFTNKGSIDGNVTFGNGTNVFNGHGGTVDGTITGGTGKDTIIAGNDGETITGGKGADALTAGTGADTFIYHHIADSTSTAFDTVNSFSFTHDKFDIAASITKIDAAVSGTVSTSSFTANIQAAASGHLTADGAMLITATSGTLKGDVFLVIDQNGTAGYQSGHDLVIELHGATGTLTTGDFI